ncbi:MAG: iron ABC transporter permease [Candidatus Cloacimonetes bacterium]|nr:iron ABC transporter permease [Candidatus Cloacimonadota bacterium]
MNRTKRILFTFLFLAFTLCIIYIYINLNNPSSHIILSIRLPRLMLAFLCGFVLAGVGYSFQIMLNNPLAEPYILGISAGAAFGSILAVVAGLYLLMPLFGFVGAIVTMILVWYLSHLGGFFNKTKLLLSGIIVGMFFSALISLIMYFNQKDIGNIINVLMGNLGHIFSHSEWNYFLVIFGISLLLMIYLFSMSNKLMILTTGDLVASSLGIDVKKLRRRIFIISSLLTGITVAYAGIIGFIGLVIPHIVRMILGGNKRWGIIFSAFGGAILLILCDFIAMHIAVIEVPVGVITAFIGCPFFLYIMARSK